MDEGMKSIILGVVFLIIAFVLIYMRKGISIWSGLLIVLSVIDIVHGLRQRK